jgi:ribosomal protein L37AE/L43A
MTMKPLKRTYTTTVEEMLFRCPVCSRAGIRVQLGVVKAVTCPSCHTTFAYEIKFNVVSAVMSVEEIERAGMFEK